MKFQLLIEKKIVSAGNQDDARDKIQDTDQFDETDKKLLDELKKQTNKEDEDDTSAFLRKLMD